MQAKNIDLNDTEEFYLETNSLLHRKKKKGNLHQTFTI